MKNPRSSSWAASGRSSSAVPDIWAVEPAVKREEVPLRAAPLYGGVLGKHAASRRYNDFFA